MRSFYAHQQAELAAEIMRGLFASESVSTSRKSPLQAVRS